MSARFPNPIRVLTASSVVLLLLVAGCSDGATTADPSPSPSASATPEPIRVGSSSPDPADPPPTATPVPDDPGTPRSEPASTVRALLDAIDREDHAAQRTLTAGPARVLMRIRAIIADENRRRGATTDERVEVAAEPSTTDATGDAARVAVDATIASVVSGDRGDVTSEATIRGPVVCEPRGGGWAVRDLVYAGRSLVDGYHPVEATSRQQGIRLEFAAVLSYKETTAALIRLVNEGGGEVPVAIRRAVLTGPDGTTHEHTQLAVESTVSPAIFVGFPLVDGRPRLLTVEIEREDTGGSWTYEMGI